MINILWVSLFFGGIAWLISMYFIYLRIKEWYHACRYKIDYSTLGYRMTRHQALCEIFTWCIIIVVVCIMIYLSMILEIVQ